MAKVKQLHMKHFNATDLTCVLFLEQTVMNYTSLNHITQKQFTIMSGK